MKRKTATAAAISKAVDYEARGYEDFRRAVADRVAACGYPLFTTPTLGLFAAFLAALPEEVRQFYNCNNCRNFIERFGGLVQVTEDGDFSSALWYSAEVPEFFKMPVEAMERLVRRSRVSGVFYSAEKTWGVPENISKKDAHCWTHFYAKPAVVFKETPLKNAGQAMAEKLEEYAMLQRGLAEFPLGLTVQACSLLKSGNLYRSEKAVAVAEWFLDLHERLPSRNSVKRDAIIWYAVAHAPVGFAHVKASMIGTLLEDLKAGLEFNEIKRRWDEKMSPTQYQRPQSPPSAGNIAQAEKVVAALQSAGALERRFARLEEIQTIWKPEPKKEVAESGGVFGHIKPKGALPLPTVSQPVVRMSFVKFRREVLPYAVELFVDVPSHGNFSAFVTATNPEAPPILQWDIEGQRNPVSWYLWATGSPASQWGLPPGLEKVAALALSPNMWVDENAFAHQGKHVFVIIPGCRDQKDGGLALFPEILKNEYRAIRKTIEAFSASGKISGRDEASACGLCFRNGDSKGVVLVARDKHGSTMRYTLDRWE